MPTIKAEPSEKLIAALADDLNTPLALSYLHEDVNLLNKAKTVEERARAKAQFLADAEMLGLMYNEPQAWFRGGKYFDDETEIESFIAQRAEAKRNKDWALADQIRNDLKTRGIILEDGPTGTTWKRA